MAKVARSIRDVPQPREVRPSGRFELREAPNGSGGTIVTVSGYASVVEHRYRLEDLAGEFHETIARDAFTRTLSENPDVHFLVDHSGMSLARSKSGTLQLSADATGLHYEARCDTANPLVVQLRSAIERGDMDESSFAFRVNRQEWNDDCTERRILEVNLHHGDVSVVRAAANPATSGLVSMRSVLDYATRLPEQDRRELIRLITPPGGGGIPLSLATAQAQALRLRGGRSRLPRRKKR